MWLVATLLQVISAHRELGLFVAVVHLVHDGDRQIVLNVERVRQQGVLAAHCSRVWPFLQIPACDGGLAGVPHII